MTGLPVLRARDVIRALQRAGFIERRVSGSHCLMAHGDDPARIVVVPLHGTKDLKPGTLRSIIPQAGLTIDAFRALL